VWSLQALLPEKRYLFYPNLAKAAGSEPLAHRLRALRPDVNIFGHTHFSWDATVEGRGASPDLAWSTLTITFKKEKKKEKTLSAAHIAEPSYAWKNSNTHIARAFWAASSEGFVVDAKDTDSCCAFRDCNAARNYIQAWQDSPWK
jgi:hypothetical protein